MDSLPWPDDLGADRHPAHGRRRLRVHCLLELKFRQDQPCCDRTPSPHDHPALKGPTPPWQAWFQRPETRQGPGEGSMARTVAFAPVMDPVNLRATEWQRASHRMCSAS